MADQPDRSRAKADGIAAAPGAPLSALQAALPAGSGAMIAAIGSLIVCYSGVVGSTLFGIKGLVFNPHFQAVLMWGLAVVGVYYLFRNRQRHGRNLPLILGSVATGTLIATLYLHYDEQIEAAALVLLVVAAFLNQNLLLTRMHETELRQSAEIAELNRQLAERVASQQDRIGRLGRLRHFLSPEIANIVIGDDRQDLLRSHRRYIACLFCDLRNFTALSEDAEPEEVIEILERFHDRAGARISARGGTIGFRSGDGIMAFFNDPVPCKEPTLDAISTALEIRESFQTVKAPLTRLGHDIGLGIGIASGFATLGLVGLQGRTDYTAIGSVVNAASRLCDAADDDQILASHRAYLDVESKVEAETLPPIQLKGFTRPVDIVAVRSVQGLDLD
ncbi:MAG: adenylate/guanylate cyclase domain-containing protein [Pseudomonadota bacterium]